MRVVADTDLLSALFKIGRTDLIYEALAADKIYITQAVFDELAKAPFFYDFVRKVERIELVSVGDFLPATSSGASCFDEPLMLNSPQALIPHSPWVHIGF